MAYKVTKSLCLLVVLLSVFSITTRAQNNGCVKTVMGLSPCLNYVSGNSSSPSASCCSQLSTIVSTQPQCLCLLLNGTASSYGFNINQTLALGLPQLCNVQTPPLSRCNSANGPSASTDNTPQTSKEPATSNTIPSGSKTGTSVNGAYKGGSNMGSPQVFLLLLATYALFFTGNFEINASS